MQKGKVPTDSIACSLTTHSHRFCLLLKGTFLRLEVKVPLKPMVPLTPKVQKSDLLYLFLNSMKNRSLLCNSLHPVITENITEKDKTAAKNINHYCPTGCKKHVNMALHRLGVSAQ